MQQLMKQWQTTATALSVVGKTIAASALLVFILINAVLANDLMLQIKDLPLKDVVLMLARQSNINIVIADESKLEKRITATLNDVPLERALDYVLKSSGVSYKKAEDGTYIIGGYPVDEPVLSKDELKLPPVETAAPPAANKEKIVTSIKLVYSKPSEILKVIGWNGVNPIPNSDVRYPDRLKTGASNTKHNSDYIYVNSGNGIRTYDTSKGAWIENGQPVAPTIDPASLNYGAGRTADDKAGAGQFPGAGTPGYIPGTRPTTAPGQPATGTTQPQTSSSSKSGDFLWPDGVDDARPFDLDNSIIVKGDADGIEQFKKIVRMLDVPPKQVMIKAEFVEVSTTDVKKFGIDWSLERLNESFNTAFGPAGNILVGLSSGNLTAQLRAQLTSDVGRVINAPIISTINNQQAYIQITRSIPYWTTIITSIGDGNVIQSPQERWIDIETYLDITPRVNGDGTITMYISPQIADTGNMVTGPDNTAIPESRSQSLFTQRRVANGETIVVGGFIRKNESNSIQKIPILADLPIVGSLFRTISKTMEDRELLIFITPTILPDPVGGTVGDVMLSP